MLDTPTPLTPTRAIVLYPDIFQKTAPDERPNRLLRTPQQSLDEAVSLSRAISGMEVVHADSIRVRDVKPGTLFGLGVVDEIKVLIDSQDINLVIVDQALTPHSTTQPGE